MWDPGFDFVARYPALLRGYHRRFCVRSTIYRGTPDSPGLVLGLDVGGECHGVLFQIDATQRETVTAYLYERELPTQVYTPSMVAVDCTASAMVSAFGVIQALTFVVRTDHHQYASFDEQTTAHIIAHSQGRRGRNADYLRHTVAALHALHSPDADLDDLLQRVLQIEAKNAIKK